MPQREARESGAAPSQDRASTPGGVPPTAASSTPTPGKRAKAPRPFPLHVSVRSRPGVVIVIPPRQVHHRPPTAHFAAATSTSVERPPAASMSQSDGLLMNNSTCRVSPAHGGRPTLYLCEDFVAPTSAACADRPAEAGRPCPRGEDCPDVHADLTNTREYFPHAIAHMSEVAIAALRYLPASLGDLEVAQPNTKDQLHLLAASECLETRALECERRPLSHCAHFRTKQLCNYGYACEFIHHLPSAAEAAFAHPSLPLEPAPVDTASPPPRARRSTLAPPTAGGESAEHPSSSPPPSRPDAMTSGLGASASSPLGLPVTAAMPQVCGAADDDDDDDDGTGNSPGGGLRNAGGGDGGASHPGAQSDRNTVSQGHTGGGGGGVGGMSLSTSRAGASGSRFRHDPYGAKGWVSVSNSFAEGE